MNLVSRVVIVVHKNGRSELNLSFAMTHAGHEEAFRRRAEFLLVGDGGVGVPNSDVTAAVAALCTVVVE